MIFLELVTQIKKAALDAFENSKPVNVVFGVVVSEDPIEIKIDQKLIIGYENLVFLTDNHNLQVNQNVVLLRAQGGQKFVVLEIWASLDHIHDEDYLGINDKAADSDKLDGLDSSEYLQGEDSGWIYPTLLNGWVNFHTNYGSARYRKVGNIVHIQGLVKSGTIGNPYPPMLNLYSGYRPSYSLILSTVSNNALGRLQVDSNGNVRPIIGSSTWFSICASFMVD